MKEAIEYILILPAAALVALFLVALIVGIGDLKKAWRER